MLTEKRHSLILEAVNSNGSAKIGELCKKLNTSESTIRRDLIFLAERGMITKVHGGAIALEDNFSTHENDISNKIHLFVEEKNAIAKYAASLINDGDFVYMDAGTTTEKMIDYIRAKNIIFVTNGFINAKKLAQKGYRVFIPGGEIKIVTEAVVGTECVLSLENYNFTKCFVGVNGISKSGGITTHDTNEAAVKSTAIRRSKKVLFLADHSKFDCITSVKFAELNCGEIITDKVKDKKYLSEATIKEVL